MADFLDTNGLRLLWEKIKALVVGKADKVANATSGNFASLSSEGNIEDSGYSSADFVSSSDLSNTPKIVIPSVDGKPSHMTSDEIAGLKVGDVVVSKTLTGDVNFYVTKITGDGNGSIVYAVNVNGHRIVTMTFINTDGTWAYQDSSTLNITTTLVENTLPQSGMLPNTVYNLGELQNNTTFRLAAATDNTIMNVWHWTFSTGMTVPAITWPSSITMWADGSAPNVVAYKYYEIKVHNGCATVISADVPQ